ncbi:MAG TPA: ATP-binding protein, partial [Chitinophagaceae bacterium]|nr:ATP-binding protein [Chitinophagaceae bacterium]
NDPYVMAKAVAAWKAKHKSLKLEFTGQELKNYNEHRNSFFETKVNFPEDQWIVNIIFFSKGWLSFSSNKNISDETFDLLKRFAAVFEQTYTRFNDLKQAEEQARESQIQLALERVRARTMAMQRSDELAETASLLFKQINDLGIQPWTSGFNIWEENDTSFMGYNPTPTGEIAAPYQIPSTGNSFFKNIYDAKKRGEEFLVFESSGESLAETYNYMKTLPVVKEVLKGIEESGIQLPTFQINHCAFFSHGFLLFITLEAYPDAYDIFKRFAKVFEQTYTRFLDLQKAEAQAREAKIEAALEKVRSRSLAMHHSDELEQVVLTIYERLVELGLSFDGALIFTFEKTTRNICLWIATNQLTAAIKINLPYDEGIADNPILKDLWNAIEKEEHIFNRSYSGKAKDDYFRYVAKNNASIIPEAIKISQLEANSWTVSLAAEKNSVLAFDSWSGQITTNADFQILKRFAKVFEQSYTRFLDLQKAEAQTREAKIEAALEKVRSRTMAMQKSDELTDVAGLLFEQVSALGIKTWTAGFNVWSEDNNSYVDYITSPQGGFIEPYTVLTETAEALRDISNARKSGVEFDVQYVEGEKIKQLYLALTKLDEKQYEIMLQDGVRFPSHQYEHFVFGSKVSLMFITYEPVPEAHDIFKRLGKVFEQTYTRFLDLKKAEAQAREAKIEAALEKVRASTMAMQRSDHLSETAFVLFKQFKELGEAPERIFIATFDDEQEGIIDIWGTNQGGNQLNKLFKVSADEPTVISKIIAAWKAKKRSLVIDLSGEELKQYISFLKSTGMPVVEGIMEDRRVQTIGCFSKGVIGVTTPEPQSAESVQLLERFAGVFDLTYTRFLDLQQAETQAREARIETALERVRSNTMAMHHSEELKEVISVTFEQLKSLNIIIDSCIINLFIDGSHDLNVWVASAEQKYPQKVQVPYLKHPLFDKTTPSKNKAGNSFTLKLSQKENQDFYKHIIENSDFGKIINEERRKLVMNAHSNIMSFANFKHTGLRVGNFRDHTYTEEENNTILRFANVFEQTYTRFLDLQKSEAQAREAIKQASVDRIRAEIASMRTTSDLERITPLIWNELKTLGVPFIRCGVFIIDEEQQQVHTFLSTPDGKANASFTSAITTVSIIIEALPYWRRKEMYKAHWDEATFIEQTKHLVEQGAVSSTNTYLTENRPKNLYLHLLPFLQGILYVGNETPLNDDELQLVQNLADAFAIAYARYEDFNKLELAKEQIEHTLLDLKQAQAQLVQSEKMASLGELTAGIAHEIQNPLNFVNNFSEVNKELLAEMNEEIEKGNLEEVKALAKDVIDNEEKINHHGKRADAIVKGMLQHSRSSSGIKEPSDINVLADEYLRLAYHGLRAKDKSFNATMKTDFDETIGKINIVPQDVGRSVLNLITNAFYAVSERKKQNGEGYEPTVTVTTKRINGKVEIRVADNGNGIPQKVLDKIFQPFFTTKPTGQGTGLGLSLSYDIVKAHNGELKVETNEGQGSAFIIFLPANN